LLITLLLCHSSVGHAQKIPTKPSVDLATINHQKIAYWLAKRDAYRADESSAALKQAVDDYINSYQQRNQRNLTHVTGRQRHSIAKRGLLRAQQINNSTEATVLAILIDFPDLLHSAHGIEPNDSDMYYANYPLAHYQAMLFSDVGFSDPKGDTQRSVKQYFGKESGQSLVFDGKVSGWHTAANNARYYGKNDALAADENVEALVIEAVTSAVSAGLDLSDFDADNDGVVDHLLIFHASIGEEAGGGQLAESAIWSHSFSVNNQNNGQPVSIAGSSIKISNYTIQPIDSATGVVAHEFGHDLGLLDEYDLKNTDPGSPVQGWSIMAAGSWVGQIRGTQPSTFSPLAREYLQQTLGGNWLTQQIIDSSVLSDTPRAISLVPVTQHTSAINQLKVTLPAPKKLFKKPYSGEHYYYSGKQSDRRAALSLTLTLPTSTDLSLSFQAQWDMELDYDYAQVLINGEPQANAQTAKSSGAIDNVGHYISGSSPLDAWQLLRFDLSKFSGQTINLEIIYVTDALINQFGLVIDDISLYDGANQLFIDNSESDNAALSHFKRISELVDTLPISYYLQYRSLSDLDSGLVGDGYEPGLLVWFGDNNVDDNNSSVHPGSGFISVVDADQVMIGRRDTNIQLRDATFSLAMQSAFNGDDHLENVNTFNDGDDYTSPEQPQSGVALPNLGLSFTITSQDSDAISLELVKREVELSIGFEATVSGKQVSVKPSSNGTVVSYQWDFGDGQTSTQATPSHTYQAFGYYTVKLVVIDGQGNNASHQQRLLVGPTLQAKMTLSVDALSLTARIDLSQGVAPFIVTVDYGDGSSDQLRDQTTTNVTFSHDYQISAELDVEVTITDALGQEQLISQKAQPNSGLTASFTHTADKLSVGFVANFDGGLAINSIDWDFGDGSSSTQQNPTHVFGQNGSFRVVLTAQDQSGLRVTYAKTITVSKMATTTPAAKKSGGGLDGQFSMLFLLLLCLRTIKWRKLGSRHR